MMISCIRYTNRLLAMLSLTASLAIVVSSCNTSDVEVEKPSTGKVTVDLALNVSTQQSTTRLSTGTTQQEASSFRGMQDWTLIPFAAATPDTPLPGVITTPSFDNYKVGDTYNYLDRNVVDAVIGTSAYLCYGKAVRADGTDNFDNGSTVASFDATSYSGGYAPNTITFTPEQICRSEAFAADTKGIALLTYLNGIAQASVTEGGTTYTWYQLSSTDDTGLFRIFQSFTNYDDTQAPGEHRLFAGSSVSIKALATNVYNAVAGLSYTDGWKAALKTEILSKITDGLTSGTDYTIVGTSGEITINSLGTARDGFPASVKLPDGAAAILWNNNAFIYTTSNAIPYDAITDYTRLVYPAELWYYTNSPIKTSKTSQASFYNNNNPWNTVLDQYTDGSAVTLDTRSIAIVNPLQYGVGCIEGLVQAKENSLLDANGIPISLTRTEDGTTLYNFPLTAVLFDKQYSQQFDFTPVSGTQYILYDPRVGSGVGAINLKKGSTTAAEAPAADKFYTLSLQTPDNSPVHIILEFQNNSGEPFYGENGIVAPGMRFYLIGTVTVPTGELHSVVTQDYRTQLTINVESLQHAYNIIPDLNTAKNVLNVVDIGIRQWKQGSTSPKNVYNW